MLSVELTESRKERNKGPLRILIEQRRFKFSSLGSQRLSLASVASSFFPAPSRTKSRVVSISPKGSRSGSFLVLFPFLLLDFSSLSQRPYSLTFAFRHLHSFIHSITRLKSVRMGAFGTTNFFFLHLTTIRY